MSEFIYHIHYSPEFKTGTPDGLSGGSGEEKSGIDYYFFDKSQLMNLKNHNVGEQEDAKDVELEEIYVIT